MLSIPLHEFGFLAGVVQLAGALLIAAYVLGALVQLALRRSIARARLLVAEGVIGGLSLMAGATSHLAAASDPQRRSLAPHHSEEAI